MFWICAENSVDNTEMFSSLLSQGLFCFSPHPTCEETGSAQEVGQGHSWDS